MNARASENYLAISRSSSASKRFEIFGPIQPTISLEMPVPSQGHYGFHSFPVVD
jgi:hypothetical protein